MNFKPRNLLNHFPFDQSLHCLQEREKTPTIWKSSVRDPVLAVTAFSSPRDELVITCLNTPAACWLGDY